MIQMETREDCWKALAEGNTLINNGCFPNLEVWMENGKQKTNSTQWKVVLFNVPEDWSIKEKPMDHGNLEWAIEQMFYPHDKAIHRKHSETHYYYKMYQGFVCRFDKDDNRLLCFNATLEALYDNNHKYLNSEFSIWEIK